VYRIGRAVTHQGGITMIHRAAAAAGLLLLLSTASVSAGQANHVVDIENYDFEQTPVNAALVDQVQWHNTTATTTHTSTADLFGLWSYTIHPGATSPEVRTAQAGLFAYHCTIHPSMHGQIKVRMQATPTSGSASTTFVIRVADINAPAGFKEVIQRRMKGGTWAKWKSTAAQTTTFKTATTGTWQFRSRLQRTSDGKATGWSPWLAIVVS
jgi:plastocyanin